MRVFLLSPANCGGKRARLVCRPDARFDIACRLREEGISIGELFSFLSGLYFRGKLAYSYAYADPPEGAPGAYVITANRGLLPVETRISLRDFLMFSKVGIESGEARYVRSLRRDAKHLAGKIGEECDVILLGSISTGKYADVLLPVFGRRLKFPAEFVGRGDMSRGGLMLRHVEDRRELNYVPFLGAIRNGCRPPRLEPRLTRRG